VLQVHLKVFQQHVLKRSAAEDGLVPVKFFRFTDKPGYWLIGSDEALIVTVEFRLLNWAVVDYFAAISRLLAVFINAILFCSGLLWCNHIYHELCVSVLIYMINKSDMYILRLCKCGLGVYIFFVHDWSDVVLSCICMKHYCMHLVLVSVVVLSCTQALIQN